MSQHRNFQVFEGYRKMKYFEFGQENPELMVLLPGGGVCYRGAIPIAEEMAKVYHVVLVAYDGFNPDEPGESGSMHDRPT